MSYDLRALYLPTQHSRTFSSNANHLIFIYLVQSIESRSAFWTSKHAIFCRFLSKVRDGICHSARAYSTLTTTSGTLPLRSIGRAICELTDKTALNALAFAGPSSPCPHWGQGAWQSGFLASRRQGRRIRGKPDQVARGPGRFRLNRDRFSKSTDRLIELFPSSARGRQAETARFQSRGRPSRSAGRCRVPPPAFLDLRKHRQEPDKAPRCLERVRWRAGTRLQHLQISFRGPKPPPGSGEPGRRGIYRRGPAEKVLCLVETPVLQR